MKITGHLQDKCNIEIFLSPVVGQILFAPDLFSFYLKTVDHLYLKSLNFISILKALIFEFLQFRILKIRSFKHLTVILCYSQSEEFENRLFNLASYLESLASIIRHMEEVSDAHALALEHLLVLLLENIPNIHSSKHFVCMRAILWILLAVMPKGTAFKQIISGFGM